MAHNTAEFEHIDSLLNKPIDSNTLTRWQRKALQSSKNQPVMTKVSPSKGDRFIPNRSAMDMDLSHFALTQKEGENSEPPIGADNFIKSEYQKTLKETLLQEDEKPRVLAFRNKAPVPKAHVNNLKVLYSQNKGQSKLAKPTRHIPDNPTRILDAPDLVDDFLTDPPS